MAQRGRPGGRRRKDDVVRRRLLAAAASCLGERPSSAVGIREIADLAGVNPAMIQYYFQGKPGLIAALLDTAVTPLLTLDRGTLQAMPPSQRSRILVARFAAIYQAHPWLPRLLTDDILTSHSELRERVITRIGARIARLLKGFIRMQQQDGYFRADLDVRQATVTLLGMLAFPMLAARLLQSSYGLKPGQWGSERWIREQCRLLEQGCRPGQY